jgi:hypothetical protein
MALNAAWYKQQPEQVRADNLIYSTDVRMYIHVVTNSIRRIASIRKKNARGLDKIF